MPLDVRTAQTVLEDALRDAVLCALGKRLPAVASVAALRAFPTRGASSSKQSNDDIIPIVRGAQVSCYRWSSTSTAVDNGRTVVKPSDVTGNGRWLQWTSKLRLAPVVGGPSHYLHELPTGILERVIILDRDTSEEDLTNFIMGAAPAVAIDARGDDPEDQTQNTGHRWDVDYDFTIYVVAENLRDRRQAAQGSKVSGESTLGANSIDGLIWSLLGGVGLFQVNDGVKNVQVGHAENWVSALAQRRVIRSRQYVIRATTVNPAAPGDAGPVEELGVQQSTPDLHDQTEADSSNYVASGITVSLGVGLTKSVSAGVAYIDDIEVDYAGELATFPANSDTYRDLLPNGTLTFLSVFNGANAPDITADAIRIGVTTTDGSSVTDDRYVAATLADYGPVITVPLT